MLFLILLPVIELNGISKTLVHCFEHWSIIPCKPTELGLSNLELCQVQTSLNTSVNSLTRTNPFNLVFYHVYNNSLSNIWNIHDLLFEDKTLNKRKQNLFRRAFKKSYVKKSVLVNKLA